jgi:hypothetical protein
MIRLMLYDEYVQIPSYPKTDSINGFVYQEVPLLSGPGP